MAYAPNYTPTTSFADDEANTASGRSTVRTQKVDDEFANIEATTNALNDNLKLLQRDDGKLKDKLVEPYALSSQTRALLAAKGTVRGEWTQNTEYFTGESLQYSNTAYLVLVNHNSGTVFVDALYMAITDAGAAAASAAASAASAAAALISQNSATSSASTATTQAGIATTQAGIATTQATNAANSASAAAAVISGSVVAASQLEAAEGTNNTKFMSPLRSRQGVANNSNALAGQIGEYVESNILIGSAIALTTAVAANVTSISLTAGDWDVSGIVRIHSNAAGTSFTQGVGSISLTAATLDPVNQANILTPGVVPGAGINYCALGVPSARISLASTTTIFLVARAAFTVSTAQAYGVISARRVR